MSLTLGTLLSGLQMGAQLFGLIPGMQTQAQNINPYTADFYNQLQTALESAQTQQAQYQGQAAGAADRLGDIAGSQQRTANEISRIEQPSANAWFDQWLQNVPEYQNVARQVSEQATQQLGRSLEEQAKLQTQQALSQVANQFAGQGFSGAAAKAAGAGAAAPITQAQSALAGEQANLFGNTFNQQAGLGQNLASQGQQNQFMNALNALSQQLAGQQTAAGSVAQQEIFTHRMRLSRVICLLIFMDSLVI